MAPELLIGYWPKLITAIWFSLYNLYFIYRHTGNKNHLVRRFITGLFVSDSFISIIGEICIFNIYKSLIMDNGISDEYDLIFIILNIVGDAAFIIAGGMIFTKTTGMNKFSGATVYMQYVCIARLSLIISTSSVSYLGVYFGCMCIMLLFLRKDLYYTFDATALEWKHVFLYLVGLFYVLDLLYGAYFVFPELATDLVKPQNIFWLDALAILNCSFVLGYEKVSIRVAREYDEKTRYFNKLRESQESIIITLAEISEAKSGETGQHVRRVAEYTKIIATELHFDPYEAETLKSASMMHDLGKLMISADIIEKPDQLTPEEYEEIKKHAQYGYDILSNSKGHTIEIARMIALQHHEKWDGSGYPNGIRGNNISLYAQIVSVADVFDALTSTRSYKKAWSVDQARIEILNQRGRQFSPVVVDAFIRSFDKIVEIQKTYAD
jgi:HD superfamily phosphodiesterase